MFKDKKPCKHKNLKSINGGGFTAKLVNDKLVVTGNVPYNHINIVMPYWLSLSEGHTLIFEKTYVCKKCKQGFFILATRITKKPAS